jgi:PKD repeat protein
MIKQLMTSTLCVLMALYASGQSEAGKLNGALLLTNHSIHLSSLEQLPAEKLPSFDGKHYLIVQGINQALQQNTIDGLTYLEYLPKNAALFSVEQAKASTVLKKIQALGGKYTPMQANWKLSTRLHLGDIPEWAWLEGKNIKVWLRLYPGVSMVKATAALKVDGHIILEQNPEDQLIALSINADEASTLGRYAFVLQVQEMEDPGTPENWTARTSHRVNYLQSTFNGSVDYDGSGVVLSLGDDGIIGEHIDYAGRLDQSAAGANNGDHGDHVAGTIFGAGNLDPRGRGMAPGLDMIYYSYPDNLNAADADYSNRQVRLTSSSYSNGCNAGYTNFTRQMDQDYQQNPNLIHVFSAGNNGTSNCGYGAGAGWGNITGGHKIAKNVVTVANLTRTDGIAGSSSRGPASDGRIKPDVGAVGTNVYSTTNPNSYTLKTGTSMSCPGTSGTLSVLHQAFKETHGGTEPNNALLKAILLNAADDLGNPGPDFTYGFGRINARRALAVIDNDQFASGSLSANGNASHNITVPNNIAQLKVMLYWGDAPASTVAARALVNDLDMTVTSGANTYLPLVLDPSPNVAALTRFAQPARDSLNNMEQVVIANPIAGDITVNIEAFNIPNGVQSYYLVYTFIENEVVITHPVGGEKFVPGSSEIIRWDAPEGTTNFTLEYSIDNGSTWNNIATVNAGLRDFSWTVPNTVTHQAKVRVTSGNSSSSPGTFTIIGVPGNLTFVSACPDTVALTWTAIPAAQGYVVYRLGAKYMDSIGYTTSNVFLAGGVNPTSEEWFSVAAVTPGGGIGLRALARERPTGIFNCIIRDDLAVQSILSPANGEIPDCYALGNIPVKARITNMGLDTVFGFTLNYTFNGGAVNTQNITDTILPGGSYLFTSASNFNASAGASASVWISSNADQNSTNDSLYSSATVYTGTTVNLPFTDDFESNIPLCSTNTDCELTVCNLSGGWRNYTNGVSDAINWRGNNGATPSSGTGPSADFNPGTTAGKYLYLEASGCFNQQASVQSPCIDLNTAQSPLMRFNYHMNGVDMGSLTVDVFDGEEWHLEALTPIVGNQGNSWREATVNLNPYVGKKVVLRFRATTGADFASDIAIDNIRVLENSAAPVAAFTADANVTCINGVVSLTDASNNFPNSRLWRVSPSTNVSFLNNDSTSAQVQLLFTAPGNYDITLIANNAAGGDTLTQTAFITVSAGATLSAFEDFDPAGIPQDWAVINPDNFTAWDVAQVTGTTGIITRSAVFDHQLNPTIGSRDDLVGLNLDLVNETDALLYFDVAYAANLAGANDSLIIMVSTDCGNHFVRTTYAKGGASLATASARNARFIPQSANDWRVDSLDLTPYVGSNIKVNFVTKSARGNALYLDNIQLVNSTVAAPVASIVSAGNAYCVNSPVSFSATNSGGAATNYSWSFGQFASPSSATGPGPHSVTYLNNVSQTVELVISNQGGRSVDLTTFNVERTPVALFSFTPNGTTIGFTDLSINNPTSWNWDFGDGNSATVANPTHTYASGGTYDVILTATNDCGTTTRTTQINVSGIGLEETNSIVNMHLFPNPTAGVLTLSVGVLAGQTANVQLSDLSGKVLKTKEVQLQAGENEIPLSLANAAQGVYLITLKTEQGERSIKAFKQ